MIARAGSGWQTLLADLSIILFMVTASALSQSGSGRSAAASVPQPSPRAEPLAVWRSEPGAPTLAQWLSGQVVDSRQQLSIVAHYAQGPGATAQQQALAEASMLLAGAGAAGRQARLVVEPGAGGIVATLAYDQSAVQTGTGMARGLHGPLAANQPKDQIP